MNPEPKSTPPRPLPGDLSPEETLHRALRVDHAGEYGAKRIYAGQLAVLRRHPCRSVIEAMAAQEERHLETFDHLMKERQVRPTALMPLWHAAGFALGAATALLGEKAAMACTVAVENVIAGHYSRQEQMLGDDEADLKQTISRFRQDEMEHHDLGLEYGAEESPFYHALTHAIAFATRSAIWLSARV